jgi:hypothetical protein
MKKLYISFVLLQLVMALGVSSQLYARAEYDCNDISLEIVYPSLSSGPVQSNGIPSDRIAPISQGHSNFNFALVYFEIETEEEKSLSLKKFQESEIYQGLFLSVKTFGLYLEANPEESPDHTFFHSFPEPDYLIFQVFRL